ncbi:MAG: right-handed parallel beta-helix repeat-containing protein [Alphaproteobacteria bacterium]|nr:right-handed parallel beta-helix repeat-containing protein [Alphaproteobacteria bacterium]MDE2110175.1 right-handed parallel beta-helix repeat-containing protein [Alphaproteobacteria bacterium]MDE2492509.1 right-handed parallel beta-helix repeat-containing protein [Alphaproteobacteria bacterium]
MSATSILRRIPAVCCGAIPFAALLWLGAAPAQADWYGERPADSGASQTAALLDPYDPVPEIGCRERGDCRDDYERRGERHGEGRHERPGGRPLRYADRDALLVDCSRQHRDMFSSVNAAVSHAPPNATILILAPGDGATCVESVHIPGPMTIATFGGGQAVIQAPPGQPCLRADIPLGDTLTIEGIRFIARGRDAPCVAVQAGHVVIRNSLIDSRTRDWAIDVHESGELTVEATHIETDGSGLHADRALVDLHNLDIDIDTGRAGVGLVLDRTDGTIGGGSLIGGKIGIAASAGTHGLELTDTKISKADTGVALMPGGLGNITLRRLAMSGNENGLIIAPGTQSQVTGTVITDSRETGIAVYGADTLIDSNKIVGAEVGIRLSSAGAFPPRALADFAAGPMGGGPDGGRPIVENNLVANVRHAAVAVEGRVHGRVIGNVFYAPGHASCFAGDDIDEDANRCHDSWLSWPF